MKEKKEKENFETILKRLEEIVEKLEKGGLDLEESMTLYEEGIDKANLLNTLLSEARGKIHPTRQSGPRY